jgi:hypothetical protein
MERTGRFGDHYRLSSGREFYANRGIVGMSPEFAAGENGYSGCFAEGYDGEEYTRKSHPESLTDEWTPAERQELADYMSALWQQWAASQPSPQPSAEDIARENAEWLEKANARVESAKRR